MSARIAVFASGGGTNLQALIDHFHAAADPAARVELVVASRAGIGALDRAARAGVQGWVLPGGEDGEAELLRRLRDHRIDRIVLAGYLRLVPPSVIDAFRGRILNIHPALLPAFGGKGMYGIRVHEAVLASGALVSGATVHRVDEEYDRGEILGQWPVPVLPGDTPGSLAARVLAVEHRLLPRVVELELGGAREAGAAGDAFVLAPEPHPDPASLDALIRSQRAASTAPQP